MTDVSYGLAFHEPRCESATTFPEGGDDTDFFENGFHLSNVKCEPEDPPEDETRSSFEEDMEPGDRSVMDFLQVKMEPEDDEDMKIEAEEEGDKPSCGYKMDIVCPKYESNTNSFGRGRYSRRNCYQYLCKFGKCRKSFASEDEIQVHMSEHVNDMRISYLCDVEGCGSRFLTKKMAERHVKSHCGKRPTTVRKCNVVQLPEVKKIFRCEFEGCGRVFGNHISLRHHARMHTGDNPHTCSVRRCYQRFASSEERDRHIVAHSSGNPFVCTFKECGFVSTSHNCLQAHFKNMHTGEKPFRCRIPRCRQQFSTKFLLDVHARTHAQLRRYVCTYKGCGKKYLHSYSLNTHMAKHSGIKCLFRGCWQSFRDKDVLEKHALSHTGDKPFLCTFEGCNDRFVSRLGMVRHRRKHKREPGNVRCGYKGCEQVLSLSTWHVHFRHQHPGMERSYRCPFEGCAETFNKMIRYHKHVPRCQPKINFICDFEGCNEEFNEEDRFMEHYRNHAVVESEPS